jgi:prepilin-type processing-associated H-X9-DG protein
MSYESMVQVRPLTDNTNTAILADERKTLLARNLKTAAVFKCPSDRSYAIYTGQQIPRVRSYSMNAHIGESSRITDATRLNYYKLEDFTRPGPASTFVFLDEHEDSINDGLYLGIATAGLGFGWNDVPANRHSKGANFAFADGHAEKHRWQDKRTLFPVTRVRLYGVAQANNKDVRWIHDHASAAK